MQHNIYFSRTLQGGGIIGHQLVSRSEYFGGKGNSLARLDSLSFRVPPFFIIPEPLLSTVFSTYLEQIEKQLNKNTRKIHDKSLKILKAFDFPDEFTSSLENALSAFPDGSLLAIRSSAVCEDSISSSYAGMFETYLFVNPRDLKKVQTSILQAMHSLFSSRVLDYRKSNKDTTTLRMALVFQQMIFSEVSGVAFSINSVDSRPEEILVNSVYGVGEGLVSGELNGDTYYLNRDSNDIRREIAKKSYQLIFDNEKGFGLKKVTLPDDKFNESSLTDGEIRNLGEVVQRIESSYRRPMDIEWAIKSGELHILQARPITQLNSFSFGKKLLWDNSNIVESYSDITLPLTFSFICRAYKTVYTQFGRLVGAEHQFAEEHERFFSNYLGCFKGRVYYNLATWYGGLALMPGFGFTKGAMEGMMGVKESFDFPVPDKSYSFFEKYFVEAPRFFKMIFLILKAFAQSESMFARFQKNFQKYYNKYKDYPFKEETPEKLLDIYWDLVWNIMWKWRAPIVADTQSMVFYGLLKKCVISWCDEDAGLANDLLAGTGDIESKLPIEELVRGGALVRSNSVVAKLVEQTEPEDLHELIQKNPACSDLKKWLADYLEKYGMRAPNELKLESESYHENPFLLMQMLKSYSLMEMDLEKMAKKEASVHKLAEKKVRKKLKGQRMFGGLFSRLSVFNWVLKNARMGIRNRENQRFARTKMYGLMRLLFNGMGQGFFERGIIRKPKDIFYLKTDEIFDYIDGRSIQTNLAELIELRKREYEGYRNNPPDERFFTWGIPYHRNTFKYTRKKEERPDLKENQLAGIGVCPGIIRGPVVLVHSPNDKVDLRGKIMVCQMTDPGWVPLFPISIGILVEKGSVLSHSAIVSREMGLPAIVGVDDLFKRLKTGDMVEFNGTTGVITILSDENSSSGESA